MFLGYRGAINRIAELHKFSRAVLIEGLKHRNITKEGQNIVGHFTTYYDFWVASYGDRFFDMGTIVRLGTTIETILRDCFMRKAGLKNLLALRDDPDYSRGIFQRIQPWTGNGGAVALYRNRLKVDLSSLAGFRELQEMMLHRHLYAHNGGVIDEEYVERLRELTGTDLMKDPEVTKTYPAEDTYYFAPLRRLNEFIEKASLFVGRLPV